MILIIRLLILVLFGLGMYWCLKFLFHPYRKLNRAIEQRRTVMMDDKNNVHRNILLVYRGVLFEGEKYMGTTEQAFQIVKINVWARRHDELIGFQKDHFEEITDMIRSAYPYAEVHWKSPVRELLHNTEEP